MMALNSAKELLERTMYQFIFTDTLYQLCV